MKFHRDFRGKIQKSKSSSGQKWHTNPLGQNCQKADVTFHEFFCGTQISMQERTDGYTVDTLKEKV